jgi:hypothetical protein
MIISTTDPISLHDVKDIKHAPHVIEGEGDTAIDIYFESEENKQAYLDIAVENPAKDFTVNLDNPQPMSGD